MGLLVDTAVLQRDGGYIQTCAVVLFPWKVSEMYEANFFSANLDWSQMTELINACFQWWVDFHGGEIYANNDLEGIFI